MKFPTRIIDIKGDQQRDTICTLARNVPNGVQVVFREPVKVRKLDQNALMWVGPLKDIAEQVWLDGRQFSAEVWHEHFKRLYLPEEGDPDLAELVKDHETWRKWDVTPSGDRVCVGSTTRLTVKGFSVYLEQVYAFGAQQGVMFRASA
ncbi:MAG: recombination protein NinB [Mizugakiibacter sp.]|uniref:recombination protein NinB n=1 Tax=Mizugakiibacter sp. TaxID=1972610 RepID=UPI003211830D